MENNKPNLGYVFRGIILKELVNESLPAFIPACDTGIVVYAGGKKFTRGLHTAISYSYNHRKKNPNELMLSIPHVICVDAKYSNYDSVGKSDNLEVRITPVSEIRVFPVDTEERVKRLMSEAKKNPTKDLIEIVEYYSGWETYEKLILEGCKEKLK